MDSQLSQTGLPMSGSPNLVAYILAPSGAGKTTWATSHLGVVDGDIIINQARGWPKEPEWWQGPHAPTIHWENYLMVRAGAAALNSPLVVFNGWFPVNHSDIVVAVLPPEDVMARNLAARQAAEPGRFPRTMDEVRANFDAIRAFVPAQHTFGDFDRAAAAATEMLNARKKWFLDARPLVAVQAPGALDCALSWLRDEASEGLARLVVNDAPGARDAVWDALGITIAAAISMPHDAVERTYREYIDSQVRRGRPIDSPHQRGVKLVYDVAIAATDAARVTSRKMSVMKWMSGKLTGSRFAEHANPKRRI